MAPPRPGSRAGRPARRRPAADTIRGCHPSIDRFAWHPEPDLLGFSDPSSAVCRGTSRGRCVGGRPRLPLRPRLRPGDGRLRRLRWVCAGRSSARAAEPGPAPTDPTPSADLLDEFRTRVAPAPAQRLPPALAQLLHAAAARHVDRRRAARPGRAAGRRRLARRADGGVRRGGGRPLAVRPRRLRAGQLRAADLGRRDGQLHRDGARSRHPPARGFGARPARPAGATSRASRVYTSDQTHFSIARALDELGFPADTLVVVPADDAVPAPRRSPSREAIARDRAAGLTPLAISAVAGSTNTGSVDLSPTSPTSPRREGLWLHVDAAYGGAARLSPRDAGRVAGLELADSVTVDPHKWFFQAYDIGGLRRPRRVAARSRRSAVAGPSTTAVARRRRAAGP